MRLQGLIASSVLVLLLTINMVGFVNSSTSISPPAGSSPALFDSEQWVPLSNIGDSSEQHPPSTASQSWRDPKTTIFVGISSYRDSRCTTTLQSIFSNAKYPDRVHVAVVDHYHTENDHFHCVSDYCSQNRNQGGGGCPHEHQIKSILLSHQEARGPNYSRYMQQQLRQSEEFCMQVDSHTIFAPEWDILALENWAAVDNEYAILSTTPPDISVLQQHRPEEIKLLPHNCQAFFDHRGMLVNAPPTLVSNLQSPLLSPLWSASFSFSKCHAEDKVPNDPQLQMIFDADEFSKYARYWTRGYDVYTPSVAIVGHDYFDKMPHQHQTAADAASVAMEWSSKNHQDFARDLYDRSAQRIASLVGFPEGALSADAPNLAVLTKYGLGSKRSLDQLIEFTGVDTRNKVVFSDRCKALQWVPFEPDADAAVDSSDIWGAAPEVLPRGGPNIPIFAADALSTAAAQSESQQLLIYPEEAFTNALDDARSYRSKRFNAAAAGSTVGGRDASSLAAALQLQLGAAESAAEKYLRAESQQALLALRRAKNAAKHRGKELWWVFQPIDSALEAVMNRIDREMGNGQGRKAIRVLLVLAPCVFAILATAVWMLTSGNRSRIFQSREKKI